MKNRKRVTLTILLSSIFIISSCAKLSPVNRVEYAELCSAANDKKTVTVDAFIQYGNKTPCVALLRADMKRDCAFKLLDKVNVIGNEPLVYLREGRESNQAETPEAGQANVKASAAFDSEQVKFRLNDGTVVNAQENIATPVTVTGKVEMSADQNADRKCSIMADKIEKR